MCSMFSILGAIFALFLSSTQAKHQWLRIYPFAAADCNGPPILGNVDVQKDACKIVPFGASSIKLMEIELGDWTREINRGATGCYFYAYTQHGCLERYLDVIVDPGDVISMCIPSRDANDPIMAVSFTCIYGEPPRRRRELPEAEKSNNGLNMTSPHVASAYRRGRIMTEEFVKLNGTRKFTGSRASGDSENGQNMTDTVSLGARNANGSAQNVTVRAVQNKGPAFFDEAPNFNSSHKLSKRESDDEPSVVSGNLGVNLTVDKIDPGNPFQHLPSHRHGPDFYEVPNYNSSREKNDTKPDKHVQLGNDTAGPVYINRVPVINSTDGQVFSVGTPTTGDSNKDSKGSESDSDDSDSDSDSDWSDDDSDDNGDEFEFSGNSTMSGNSTSLGKRNPWWQGPRRGVWMLHPWTGGLLCYDCYSKHKNQLSRFECRWGYKQRADCGEKPLAPVFTKTVTIQPVVTVTPLPGQHTLEKRSWHMPVYLQNPWYPGITVCSIAEWEGKGKRWNQEIRIEQMHKKLKKCDKSPIAQNIAVFIRTATSTAPVKTVSIIDEGYNTVIPPPVNVVSTDGDNFKAAIKTTVTTFEPIVMPTTSASSSESTSSVSVSVSTTSVAVPASTTLVAASVSTTIVAVSEPSASVVTSVLPVGPLPASLPMGSYVEPFAFSTVIIDKDATIIQRAPAPTDAPEMANVDLSPYAGVFTTVVVVHSDDAPEPEPEPKSEPETTPQPQLQNMFNDPNIIGFKTVIVQHGKDTP